ncbi:MAG: hypothetical protein ACFFC7_28710 [Candidatus Hermodarchaeota archaeon]
MLLLLKGSPFWVAVQPRSAQSPMYYFNVTIIISDNSDPVTRNAGQFIVNELPKFGIIPTFYLLTEAEFNERVFGSLSHEDYENGGFDIAMVQHSPLTTFDHRYNLFHSSNIKPASHGTNYFPVDNKTLDGILEYVMNTTDFEERKEWIHQALELIVLDIHPMIVFYHETKGPNAWTFLSLSYNILKGAGGRLTNKLARLSISHMVPHSDIYWCYG